MKALLSAQVILLGIIANGFLPVIGWAIIFALTIFLARGVIQ